MRRKTVLLTLVSLSLGVGSLLALQTPEWTGDEVPKSFRGLTAKSQTLPQPPRLYRDGEVASQANLSPPQAAPETPRAVPQARPAMHHEVAHRPSEVRTTNVYHSDYFDSSGQSGVQPAVYFPADDPYPRPNARISYESVRRPGSRFTPTRSQEGLEFDEPIRPLDDGINPMVDELPNMDGGETGDETIGISLDGAPSDIGQESFASDGIRSRVGQDFNSPADFDGGLVIFGPDVAMKIGGYVKADLIYDFDAIDSTDLFNVVEIPPDAAPRRNARFHSRQTRFNMDTRWKTRGRPTRLFVEGDFFSENSSFRLRHAYGEVGPFLAGLTWTTFTDVAAAPATIDFEGSVSSVNRRQSQVRFTAPVWIDRLTASVSLEDPRGIVDVPDTSTGAVRQATPDAVARMRLQRDWGQFQLAFLARELGYQVEDRLVRSDASYGTNFTGVVFPNDQNKVYYQIVYGRGIGSYHDLPDAAPTSIESGKLLGFFGWMVGFTHDWNEEWSTNYTFGKNTLETTAFQGPGSVAGTTYSALNLIWQPTERIATGIEYLYGVRKSNDRSIDDATRLQISFVYYLP